MLTKLMLCAADALRLALQQQTSLAHSGCTIHLLPTHSPLQTPAGLASTRLGQAGPKPKAPGNSSPGQAAISPAETPSSLGQAASGPMAPVTSPGQAGISSLASVSQSPSLVMSSRGAVLLVVTVQLKTGYLKAACVEALAYDKAVKQLIMEVTFCLTHYLMQGHATIDNIFCHRQNRSKMCCN